VPTRTYKKITKEQMPIEDRQLLDIAIERGEYLAVYDDYCWQATDILLEHKDELDLTLLGKYIYSAYDGIPSVYFGKSDSSGKYIIAYSVKWSGDKPVFMKNEKNYSVPVIDTLAKSINKFIKKVEEISTNKKLKNNYYCLPKGDTLYMYAWPGSTNSNLFFCGGFKGAYTTKNDSLLYCIPQHSRIVPVALPIPENQESHWRSLPGKKVLTEIDFAQSLILMKLIPTQIIITQKYYFYIKYDNNIMDYSLAITQ
jgi:hypothetical protein